MQITTKRVDYSNPDDCRDLISMQSEYARHAMGHDPPELHRLPERLASMSTAFSILAYEQGLDRPIGLINCFFGFSTFKSRPLVNIHDVIVTESHRGQGVSAELQSGMVVAAWSCDDNGANGFAPRPSGSGCLEKTIGGMIITDFGAYCCPPELQNGTTRLLFSYTNVEFFSGLQGGQFKIVRQH